jgi:hypothetical protein
MTYNVVAAVNVPMRVEANVAMMNVFCRMRSAISFPQNSCPRAHLEVLLLDHIRVIHVGRYSTREGLVDRLMRSKVDSISLAASQQDE